MKPNALNRKSKLSRGEKGPFLCCFCFKKKRTSADVVDHTKRKHKNKTINECNNSSCIRPAYPEDKSEHKHVFSKDLNAGLTAAMPSWSIAAGKRGRCATRTMVIQVSGKEVLLMQDSEGRWFWD